MITQPHEEKYCLSPQNMEYAHQMVKALVANDEEKMAELDKKLVLPLSQLKALGKEDVLRRGLPTITAEIVNDTDWLK